MRDVLLLNADWSPMRILDWQRAVCMLVTEKVTLVEPYGNQLVRAPSVVVPWPSVVILRNRARGPRRLRFSRQHVIARDRGTCQYCGTQGGSRAGGGLTIDHVVPRSTAVNGRVILPWSGESAAVSSWANTVACCRSCNTRKGARTPDQAGMPLQRLPKKPGPWDALRILLGRREIPESWRDYLPVDIRAVV